MKQKSIGIARGVQLCSTATDELQGITIGGETFVPDAATAYVELYLSHAFPVYLDVADKGEKPAKTAIHPQVVANSYRSLRGKVLNLGHLMRSYDPDNIVRDRILGTVMAVEFPPMPEGGWKVQGDWDQAPGIRAVAAMHKNAEGVKLALQTWEEGRTPFGDMIWTCSMENESHKEDGGFLIQFEDADITATASAWQAATPPDFKALGWTYVPWADAPKEMRQCLMDDDYLGVAKDYAAPGGDTRPTLFLNGGLNGSIFYFGVALTPAGKESRARVSRMMASADKTFTAAATMCDTVVEICREIFKKK